MSRDGYTNKTGLLGGTFNPPHLGHLFMAETLYEEFCLDDIIFIPVGDPPHKKDRYIAPAHHRLNMLSLMTADRPHMSISDIETRRSGYTYTVDTLTRLTEQYGGERKFFYIIGSDTLFQLKSWKSFETVSGLTSFLCVRRPGDDMDDIQSETARLKREYGASVILSAYEGPAVSSTNIIKELKQNGWSSDLHKSVMEYIEKHHVFG